MKALAGLLLLGLVSCDRKSDPAASPGSAVNSPSTENGSSVESTESTYRPGVEGKVVYTIKCDPCWHSSSACSGMDMYRSSFEVMELKMKDGVLMEHDTPFRTRFACPRCARG